MSAVTRSIDVAAPPAVLRAVIDDYASYPAFLPEAKEVRILSRDQSAGPGFERVEVTYRLDVLLKTFEYTLLHEGRGPLRVDWRLLRGEFMKHNVGSWSLEALEDGGTRATYTIELRLGGGVPPSVETALAEKALPRLLTAFRDRAQARARESIPVHG